MFLLHVFLYWCFIEIEYITTWFKPQPLWDLPTHRCSLWWINYSSAQSLYHWLFQLMVQTGWGSRNRTPWREQLKKIWSEWLGLYSHEIPAGGSALQAVQKTSHCQCPRASTTQSTDSRRQRGKGRVCLGEEEGDSEEEEKGKGGDQGEWLTRSIGRTAAGRSRGAQWHMEGGREYAEEMKSQGTEWGTHSLAACCKGVWLPGIPPSFPKRTKGFQFYHLLALNY